jgi:hypothetical protein
MWLVWRDAVLCIVVSYDHQAANNLTTPPAAILISPKFMIAVHFEGNFIYPQSGTICDAL